MKGMISLQINHHQEEFMSSVQNLLLRMRVILKQYSNNEHLQNYGKKLTFDKFLKMDDSDLVEFNRVYEEFVKLRAEKDERIAQKRNEEIAESIKRNINMRYNLNLMKTEEDEEQKIGLTKGPTFRATQPEEIKLSIEEDSIDSMSGASKDEPGIFQLQQKQKLQKENKTLFEDFLNQRKEEVDESIETEEMLLEEDLLAKGDAIFDITAQQIYTEFGNKGVFKDRDFYGNEAIYGNSAITNDYGIDHWERIKEMNDSKGRKIQKPEVIVNGIDASDIGQGAISD